MPNIIKITDPRGKTVVCSEDTWNRHIVKHHPEMKNRMGDVVNAISDPDFICEDINDEDTDIYIAFITLKTTNDLYLRVIVKFDRNFGRVLSAFPAANGKTGETIIWMRSKA